ncbi:MAG: OmpH family outer membrane protein [Proteobacteria bacterium]|nr:OmpH family outer membrane protein [Pseudomonadota bacterium]MBU1595747.1 OmpH family outer membrane protein [Pseudomonadota bacterium]
MRFFNPLRNHIFVAALLALILAPLPAFAQQKIGFVNPQRVVNETRLGQTAKADLARYVQEKDRAAKDSAAQLAGLRKEAEAPGLSAQDRARREDLLHRKSAQHEQLLAENLRDVKAEEGKLLQYVMRRAESALEDLGRKGGYAIIFTDPAAVGYVDKATVDLTDRLVRELDGRGK